MNWRKENNVLILETGKKIEFDFIIKGIKDISVTTGIDVQLDVPDDKSEIENSYVIPEEDGEILAKDIVSSERPIKCYPGEDLAIPEKCTINWAKEGEILIIENEKRVTFDYPIATIFETCGILIVVLDIPPKESMTENVFAVSKDGKILWQIERTPKTASYPVNRYVGVGDSRIPGIAVAFNWNCTNVYIDIKTGKVLDTEFTK